MCLDPQQLLYSVTVIRIIRFREKKFISKFNGPKILNYVS